MPRGTSRYDEARLQGRLWTPAQLRGHKTVGWWNINRQRRDLGIHSVNPGGWLTYLEDGAGANPMIGSEATNFGLYNIGYWKSPERTMSALEMTGQIRQLFTSSIAYGANGFSFHGTLMSDGTAVNRTLVCGATGSLDLRVTGAGAVNVVRCFQADLVSSSFTVPVTGPIMFGADLKSNFTRMQGNGRFEVTATDGAFTQPVTTMGINPQGNVECLTGGWSELVYATPMLSQHEAELVSGYLAWSSGMVYRLAASHPFARRPPLIGD